MTTNDAMNKALRTANGRGAFTVDETPSSPGKDWLRAEVEAAKLRGTADNPALGELPPVVVAPVVSHGSADGGAGTHSSSAPMPSMNEWIRGSADAAQAARARDRGR